MLYHESVGELIENSLTFEYYGGGFTSATHPYTTEWRIAPFAVYNQWIDGDVLLEFDGGPTYTIPRGDGSLVGEGIRHRVTTLTPGTGRVWWSNIKYTLLSSVDILRVLGTPVHIPASAADGISQLNKQFCALPYLTDDVDFSLMIERKILGYQLLTLLLPIAQTTTVESLYLRQVQRLQPAIQYMHQHIDEKMSRTELADLIGVSPTHFHLLFKETMGVAPMEYLKRLRISAAQRLLVETPLSMNEISERVGIHDQFQFSRVFKDACGISPSRYRQKELRHSFYQPGGKR